MDNSLIIVKDKFKELLKVTLDDIVETLTRTLGPYGSDVMLINANRKPEFSKDGNKVLGRIMFKNRVKAAIQVMIKQIADDVDFETFINDLIPEGL